MERNGVLERVKKWVFRSGGVEMIVAQMVRFSAW